ncbi:tRNA synthetase class II (D K and N) [Pirellula staleyi DSM 6068]|uniref:tRNA synthetase class II (D K and N) n=1 Tax=Pirellula staleyi (strain ATCC 27377 / DSM 6068 / ICPB 4128) TaxID=530564 RepID=D2R4K6_PIRSD|nr:EF-P lysine aminoacylase EpmA [Pirellula staleyi]ADB17072.1 tRNA synthetase class II (D K and N) [Pirellula staleyi DSM 6068]
MNHQRATTETFRPTASTEMIARRSQLLRTIRDFFHTRDFLEVETPLLSRDSVIDLHLDPLPVTLFKDPVAYKAGPTYWLQTSPEFGMKRLLVTGIPAIYQITRAFRGGETGPLHNPEFTMLEWYRVGDNYAQGMSLLADFAQQVIARGEPVVMTFDEAFVKYAGLSALSATSLELSHKVLEIPQIAGLLDGEEVESSFDRDFLIDLLLTQLVQPQLGTAAPVILCDFPATQSALARVRETSPPVAERFELYVDGIELANGYHELLDAEVLQKRNAIAQSQRKSEGKYAPPMESELLRAMQASALPACSGTAVGVDRLLMVISQARSIDEVITFPIDRA